MKMRFGKRFLTGLLTAALVVGAAMPALADEPASGGSSVPAPAPDHAYLNKYLKAADGTDIPDMTFTFTFAPVSDSAYDGTSHMPGQQTATVTTGQMETTNEAGTGNLKKSIALNTIFPDSLFANYHAGVYEYSVTEANSYTAQTTTVDGVTTTETVTNDTNAYTVRFYVVNGDDGKPTVEQVTVEDPDREGGKKVDPSDTDPTKDIGEGDDKKPAEPGNTEGFTFVNSYEKEITKPVNPDPDDPQGEGKYGVLGVTKTVEGKYGDKTADFPFTIKVTIPANSTKTSVEAGIYTGKSTTPDSTVAFDFSSSKTCEKTFNLKHGQALAFTSLPSGSTYEVTERLTDAEVKDKAQYTPSVKSEGNELTDPTGQKGTNLVVGKNIVKDDEAENNAHFKNKFDDTSVTPTGIVINNLPYFLMIMVAAAGIILYETKKRARV